MQNDRFVVLTGHLSNYPLSDLVGILRHQRKSGRLLIEYAKGPATFFFQNGELVDARMNELTGLQAIVVAMAQPEAAFNFNPLIQTPRRSIEPSLQRVVSELLGCWDESTVLQIEAAPVIAALPPATPSSIRRHSPRSPLLVAAVLVGVGLSTVIAVTGGFKTETTPAPAPAVATQTPEQQRVAQPEPVTKPTRVASVSPKRTTDKPDPKTMPDPKTISDPKTITVTMQIENGRVLNASIANRRPGMENYEALALRIARQRRFAPTVNGGETVTITVRPQD
jgi:hypothetical protein